MNKSFNTLAMDLRRAFLSRGFWITASAVCILYYIGIWNEIKFAGDFLYLFKYSTDISSLNPLIAMLCVLPYTHSFCSDWNSQYIKFVIVRSGQDSYGISKVIACALSSGCAIALGMILFFISSMPWIKFVSPTATNFSFFSTQTLGGGLLLQGQYFLYLLTYIYLAFLTGAFWSVLGLCASAYIPNKYVALCTPFIAAATISLITVKFPVWLRLDKITEGSCILNGTFFSLSYATLIYTTLTIGAGMLFVKTAKRRMANG
jgi:hypothetical protein